MQRKLRHRHRISLGWPLVYLLMIVTVLFTSLPIIYMLVTAFKPIDELYLFPPKFWVKHPTWDNFLELFYAIDGRSIPFTRYIFNSALVTALSMLLSLFVCSMGAYVVDKVDIPGRKAIFNIIIYALMFSPPAGQIPIYIAISKMRLLDTYWALILPKIAVPMYFFLIKQFLSQLPEALAESARLDGANEFVIYWKIFMPICKPALSTVVVFSFVASWNDWVAPLIYISSQSMKTLPFVLSSISSGGIARAGAAAAGVVLTTVPTIILFVMMQSKVMKTMAHSGIKA